MFDKSLIYPVFALLVGVVTLLIIPKKLYKRYFLYGIIFGAGGDVISVIILSKILHLFQYKNMGVFNLFNITSIWTPITWMFVFCIFFYLMPVRKLFLFPYMIAFILLSVSVGSVMEALGLMVSGKGFTKLLAILPFALWYSTAAWIYIKSRAIPLR